MHVTLGIVMIVAFLGPVSAAVAIKIQSYQCLFFKTRIVQNVALSALLTARISSSQAIELPFSAQVFSFQT